MFNHPGGAYALEWSAPTVAGSRLVRITRLEGGLEIFQAMLEVFSRDWPFADGQQRHRCRSTACASGGSSVAWREPTPRSRDQAVSDSQQP
jgi:hypothetical protein